MAYETPPHITVGREFYEGMTQAVREADIHFSPMALEVFVKRDLGKRAEQAFNARIVFSKRIHQDVEGLPRAPIPHTASRFMLEYFSCISAINLYRLENAIEQFKAELLSDVFFQLCSEEEMEWLGVYNADLPKFYLETGHQQGQWRVGLIVEYLKKLQHKSSLDSDTLIAIRHFLERMHLSKNHDVPVTPAMEESIAKLLEHSGGWLQHYLKFHPL